MSIEIATGELRAAAIATGGVASNHSPWAEIREGLCLRSMALEHELTVRLGFDDEFPLTTVNARDLATVMRKAPHPMTTIALDGANLVVRSGSYAVELTTGPVDALPVAEDAPAGTEFDFRPVALAATFAGTDNARPVLAAVRVCPDRLMATDSYKAVDWPVDTGLSDAVSLPLPAVKLALSLGMELVRVSTVGSRIALADDEAQIIARTIDGSFPNLAGLFPSMEDAATLTVDAGELTAALDRLNVLNPQRIVDLTVDGRLLLRGGSGSDEVACAGTFDERIRFDSSYLATVAKSFEGSMQMEIASPLRAVLCTGEKEDHRCLLMPQRINV